MAQSRRDCGISRYLLTVTAVSEVVVSYRMVRVSALLDSEISTAGLRQSDTA